MRLNIVKSKNAEQVYIIHSYRKNGKNTTCIHRKLGNMKSLIEIHGSREAALDWAREEARKETEKYDAENDDNQPVMVPHYPNRIIEKDEERLFQVGYLFLQSIYYDLGINKIVRNIRDRYKFEYDLNEILRNLIYARILEPCSKRSSYDYVHAFVDAPSYELHDSYRALKVLASEFDFIQSELFKNSRIITNRDVSTLYYDCTNYYFEIEIDDGFRMFGKGKEHRPNPIVTMGLFMDSKGMPVAFDLYEGNKNEQLTLKPLENKIIRDFDIQEFIYCSDSGLASSTNKKLNSIHNRKYVITQSLKKLKKDDKECALNPKQFRKIGSEIFIDISQLDETNDEVFNSIYYKEMPGATDDEIIIVTYSPKYKKYQQSIREKQISRANNLISSSSKIKNATKNPNDPKRFIAQTNTTENGEVATETHYSIDWDKIAEEAKYDGFYAVCTNLNDNVSKVIEINKRRWEIEECFRIMKTDFEARPVYVSTKESIKAHFLTCFMALLIYRILEEKLEYKYTITQTLETLRSMKVLKKDEYGYSPAFKRTDLTDELHEKFGFRLDNEIIKKSKMRNIISKTKKK